MQVVQKVLCLATFLILSGCAVPLGGPMSESIEVKGGDDRYAVSAPGSRLTMAFPKGNWLRKEKSIGGATGNPRYFYFENSQAESLILSGWFEPENRSIGLRPQWESATASWKQRGLPEPVNVSFEKLGSWDAVWYDHYVGKVVSSHLRAHRVQAGTWIDLHISTTTYKSSADNRMVLKRLLQEIAVTEKN